MLKAEYGSLTVVFIQEPEHLVEQSHKILTAIVSGMRKEEPK